MTTSTDQGRFLRIWRMPKRCLRGASLRSLTPRGQYLVEQSMARFDRRPDAFQPSRELLRSGEIGRIDSFRITCN